MKNELAGNKISKYFSKFFYDLGMMLIGAGILGKIFGKELTGIVIMAVILGAGYFIVAGAVLSIFTRMEDKND